MGILGRFPREAATFCLLLGLVGTTGFSEELVFDDLDRVHPDYKLTTLHNDAFKPQVSDLDWLPDGRIAMVVIHPKGQNLTGIPVRNSELWILPKPDSAFSATPPRFIDSLTECIGIEVVDGKIYVAEKLKLMEYTLSATDSIQSIRKVADIPHDTSGAVNFQEHPFGLLYRGGYFYTANAGAVALGGGSFAFTPDTLTDPFSGGVLKIKASDGSLELINGGLRGCNGLAWGPDSSIWVTDNQGSWLPSSKLIVIDSGRNYGYFNGPNGYANIPETWPVVWMPHGDIARSPTHPAYITQGRYQGQFLIGDLSQGGIKRAFIEKVAGEWQGAVFSFSGGLFAGVQKILMGSNGEMIVGGLGQGDYQNWGWRGKTYGFQILKPLPNPKTFEILAVHSRIHGMELEFTAPLGTDFEFKNHWHWTMAEMKPNAEYGGGNMIYSEQLEVRFTQISENRRSLYFEMDDIKAMHVLEVKAVDTVLSDSGMILRCPGAWYTLKNINPIGPFAQTAITQKSGQNHLKHFQARDSRTLQIQAQGIWEIRFFDIHGRLVHSTPGQGKARIQRPLSHENALLIGEWVQGSEREVFRWAPVWNGISPR